MEFDYTEEQLALQDTLQRFISRDYDFDKRKGVLRSEAGFSADAWKQYAELGLLALPLPEESGGAWRHRRGYHGGDGAVRPGPVDGALLEQRGAWGGACWAAPAIR